MGGALWMGQKQRTSEIVLGFCLCASCGTPASLEVGSAQELADCGTLAFDCAIVPDAWPPGSRRICDGGPGVRFAIRIPSSGPNIDAPRSSVMYELGYTYLFVDGACHYWSLGS